VAANTPGARVGRRWGGAWRARRGGGSKRTGRGLLPVLQGEFLEDEVITSLQEGGEGPAATKKGPDVAEAFIEAANHVEDEGAVGDDLAKGSEIICHLLEAPAVISDREVTLNEVAKLPLQVDGTCLPIAKELGLDGEPGVPGGGALGGDDLSEIVDESPDDPELDHAVYPSPVRGDGIWRGEADVILERKLAENEQELVAPATEVAGVDVEGNGDESPDVLTATAWAWRFSSSRTS
jgi:hypothetical protein